MDERWARVLKGTLDDKRTYLVKDLLGVCALSPWHLYATRIRTRHQPYHNYQHCYKVALGAVAGADAEGLRLRETRLLFLAGLYHDHNHTGRGDVSDQVNIRRAIRGARLWLRVFNHGLTREDIEQVLWLIAITENNHATPLREPWEGVLRDADLLGTCGDVDDELWRQALAQELGQPVTALGTAKFFKVSRWETAWGKTEAMRFIQQVEAGEHD